MTAAMKTLVVGAAIALAVAMFTMQAARAGELHHALPFLTDNPYAADAYEEDVEYYGRGRAIPYGDEINEAVTTARGVAREYLDGDLGGVLETFDD